MRGHLFYAQLCAVLLVVVAPAFAGFTTINAPFFTNEDSRVQILQTMYGGTFAPVGPGDLSYTNGTVTALRVEDYSDLNLNGATNAITPTITSVGNGNLNGLDQLWSANFTSAKATAVFGAFNQKFGYIDGQSGGTYHNLFDATGWGYSITGESTLTPLLDNTQTIRWARSGDGRTLSSQMSDNSDGLDHMVTYRITGLDTSSTTWLLMWEDKLPGEEYADFDYNDLVVKIEATSAIQVPEPASAALLLLGSVFGLGMRRRHG